MLLWLFLSVDLVSCHYTLSLHAWFITTSCIENSQHLYDFWRSILGLATTSQQHGAAARRDHHREVWALRPSHRVGHLADEVFTGMVRATTQ